ncbi:MAG: roadblock/LC7 domain-containing protein [Verrucomicrobiota bacterium]
MSRPAAPAQVPNRAAAQPPMQAPISPIAPAVPRMPLPVPQPQPQEPMAAPAPARPAAEVPSFIIPLATVAETWAEPIRYEIGELGVQDAKLALPIDIAEQALKRGRVAFPWNVLRSWIRPAPAAVVSMHDNAMLEIPLKVLAPLFIQRQKESARVQQKVAIDENIPNLFFGFPQPAGAPAPEPPEATPLAVSKPADTNYFAWNESANEPAPEEPGFRRADGMPGTGFVTRCATPNEVVSRAAALDGVAGALIALPDGLMVASRLAPDLNGDTLAAFLPHIFGKVSQCTKELRMGELNNLNFTVGNVPWKIFRVNAIFFAAFGRAGQALPTGQLAALAAELDRKKQ